MENNNEYKQKSKIKKIKIIKKNIVIELLI